MLHSEIQSKKRNYPRLRAAVIVRDESGHILLLQHVRRHGKYWVLPGGGVDAGETIEEAIIREVAEELGVACRIDRLVAIGEMIIPDRHVVDFFLTGTLERHDSFQIKYEEGIADAEWFEPSALVEIRLLPPEVIPVLQHGDERRGKEVEYLGKYKISR